MHNKANSRFWELMFYTMYTAAVTEKCRWRVSFAAGTLRLQRTSCSFLVSFRAS